MNLAISTTWNSQRHENAADFIKEITDIGIYDLEAGYKLTPKQLEQMSGLIPEGKFKVNSMHNFCPTPPEHKCSWGDDFLLSSRPFEALVFLPMVLLGLTINMNALRLLLYSKINLCMFYTSKSNLNLSIILL